jgi:hypothetical protein
MIYTDITDIENHIKLLNDDSDIPTTKILLKLKKMIVLDYQNLK